LGAQLARHRAEDARADRLHLGREQHRGVAVEADQRAVGAAHALAGAHHDGVVDLAFLDPAARRGVLDAHLDDVADRGVTALRAAEHLDALYGPCAGVIGDVQHHHGLLHLVARHPAEQLALVLGRGGSTRYGWFAHLAAFSFMMVRTRAMSRRTFFSWLVLPSCWVATCMRRPNWARSSDSSSFCSSSACLPRSSLGFMPHFSYQPPSMRCTTMVRNGSLAEASAK